MQVHSCFAEEFKIPAMAESMFRNGEKFESWQIEELRKYYFALLSPELQSFVQGLSHQHLKYSKGRPSSHRDEQTIFTIVSRIRMYAQYQLEERASPSLNLEGSPSERAFKRVSGELQWNVEFASAKNSISKWQKDPSIIHTLKLFEMRDQRPRFSAGNVNGSC